MSAKDDQIGGEHYKDLAIQPAEYIYRNGLDYLQGNVIKYEARARMKGGLEDYEKAKWYQDELVRFLKEEGGK